VGIIAHGEGWQGAPTFALQMGASLAVAIAAYELVEQPLRYRFAPKPRAHVAVS
jgi:peptidoglycan/LPS O-acetylase OafA/YrhL